MEFVKNFEGLDENLIVSWEKTLTGEYQYSIYQDNEIEELYESVKEFRS